MNNWCISSSSSSRNTIWDTLTTCSLSIKYIRLPWWNKPLIMWCTSFWPLFSSDIFSILICSQIVQLTICCTNLQYDCDFEIITSVAVYQLLLYQMCFIHVLYIEYISLKIMKRHLHVSMILKICLSNKIWKTKKENNLYKLEQFFVIFLFKHHNHNHLRHKLR